MHGVRPTAVEAYQDGYNPRSVRERAGSWSQFVASMGDLPDEQRRALELHTGRSSTSLDTTDMVKSYKMLVLLAMLERRAISRLDIDRRACPARWNDLRPEPRGRAKISARPWTTDRALIRLLEQNPIAAWAGGKGTGGVSYFAYENGTFRTTFNDAPESAVAVFRNSCASWPSGASPSISIGCNDAKAAFTTLKVSHSSGKPILFLPTGPERGDLPNGWTAVQIDGRSLRGQLRQDRDQRRPQAGRRRRTSCRESFAAGLGRTPELPGLGIQSHLQLQGSRMAPGPDRASPRRIEALAELLARRDPSALWPRVLDGDLECRLRQDGPGTSSCSYARQVRPRGGLPVSRTISSSRDRVRVAKPEPDGSRQRRRSGHQESPSTGHCRPSVCADSEEAFTWRVRAVHLLR